MAQARVCVVRQLTVCVCVGVTQVKTSTKKLLRLKQQCQFAEPGSATTFRHPAIIVCDQLERRAVCAMALLVRTVAAACAVLTLFVCTVGASSAATTASLQLVNEGFPIPHGLTVTSTVAPPAAAVTDADTTLFAAVQRNSFTSYTSVATAAQTLSLVNVTTGAVVGAVAVAAGDFAAGEEYTLFVGPDGAQEGALTGRIMPSLPKSSDWPAQHVDVALFRVLSADLTHAVVAVNTTSSNCWECLAVFREAASPMPMIANFMTASVRFVEPHLARAVLVVVAGGV